MPRTRTDFVTAVSRTLDVLQTGEAYTQNKLAAKTALNLRTIQKILQHLTFVQKSLNEVVLDVSVLDSAKIIRMREKSGLASFPQTVQQMIIKTAYFPTTSREEEILVHFLINNSITKKSAISIPEDTILKKLINGEQVIKTKNKKYYLSEDGKIVAMGALKLYPELANIIPRREKTLEDGLFDWIKHNPQEAKNVKI